MTVDCRVYREAHKFSEKIILNFFTKPDIFQLQTSFE
jgi:hypothetical protein